MGFEFNRVGTPKVIRVASPDVQMDYKSLYRAIREWQALPMNMDLNDVAVASGEDTLGGVFETALTVVLSDEWQVRFWEGVGRGFGAGGNLVGGYDGKPLEGEPDGGDTVKQLDTQGGVVVTSGSGVTEQDKLDIADRVWDEDIADHEDASTVGEALGFLMDIEGGRWTIDAAAKQMVFYKADNSTEIMRFDLKDADGNPIDPSKILVHNRVRV